MEDTMPQLPIIFDRLTNSIKNALHLAESFVKEKSCWCSHKKLTPAKYTVHSDDEEK